MTSHHIFTTMATFMEAEDQYLSLVPFELQHAWVAI